MSERMISLAAARRAIKSVIDYYGRDIAALRERAAQRDPGEEPEEGEEALLLAAQMAQEGADRALHALATARVFEAVDFAAKRIIDKSGLPEQMHDGVEAQAVYLMLQALGETAHRAGMVDVRWSSTGLPWENEPDPTRSKVTLRFIMLRPEAGWRPPEGGEQEWTPDETS